MIDRINQVRRCRRPTARLATALLMLALIANGVRVTTPTAAPPAAANGSCALGLAAGSDDETAVHALLAAEGEHVVNQDIDALMRLWAADGRVSDAKNTPEEMSDDQTWDGKDAIRHRYVRTVFPGAPSTAQPSDLEIEVIDDLATVTATTHIGDEVSPAGDRWQLVRVDGCWLIISLTYNLEPKTQ